MDAWLWVALSGATLLTIGWLVSKINIDGGLAPEHGKDSGGDREPRDPRPLVLTGSAREPIPDSKSDPGYE